MAASTPDSESPLVRLASPSDIEALSRLLVQLYQFEVPRMLRGDAAAQREVARRLLSSTPSSGRYVLVRGLQVIAMGSLATRDAPRPATPPTVLLAFPSVMGWPHALGSFAGVLRGLLTVAGPPGAEEAQIHSVVVDTGARGDGVGSLVMEHLERQAISLGKLRIVVQVLASNSGALAFYRARGYEDDGPAHRPMRDAFAFPSLLMHKDIG